MKTLTILLALIALTGCVNVPKTTITGSIGGQPFSVSSPKDSQLTGLEVTAETNGQVRIKIASLTAKMNPEVITTTGDAQVKLVNAVGDVAGKAAAMALSAAAK